MSQGEVRIIAWFDEAGGHLPQPARLDDDHADLSDRVSNPLPVD